jgi:hypothetical protein
MTCISLKYKLQNINKRKENISMTARNKRVVFTVSFLVLFLGLLGSSITVSSPGEGAAFAQVATPNASNTTAQSTGDNATTGHVLFFDPPTRTSFQYPTTWEGRSIDTSSFPAGTEFAVRLLPPGQNNTSNYVDNVIVNAQNTSMTLAQFTSETLDQYRNLSSSINVVTSEPTTIAGNPAHKIETTQTFQGLPIKQMQVWTVADNRVYLITYGADESEYSQYVPDVETIANTLRINVLPQTQQQSLDGRQAHDSFI